MQASSLKTLPQVPKQAPDSYRERFQQRLLLRNVAPGSQSHRAGKRDGRLKWKYSSGYFEQSRVENAFVRYKTIFGDSFRARLDAGQASEGALDALILNRMQALAKSETTRIR